MEPQAPFDIVLKLEFTELIAQRGRDEPFPFL
jgi:hypothetical protein